MWHQAPSQSSRAGNWASRFGPGASAAALPRLMPVKKIADRLKHVLSPMPELVVSIAVKDGQEVKAGETVAVVEAMKMENVLRAEIDGTVKKICLLYTSDAADDLLCVDL